MDRRNFIGSVIGVLASGELLKVIPAPRNPADLAFTGGDVRQLHSPDRVRRINQILFEGKFPEFVSKMTGFVEARKDGVDLGRIIFPLNRHVVDGSECRIYFTRATINPNVEIRGCGVLDDEGYVLTYRNDVNIVGNGGAVNIEQVITL